MVTTINKKKLYDTCGLLSEIDNEDLFAERFYVSSVTLHELENIKTSKTKTEDVRYKARKLSHILDEHYNDYDVVVYNFEISDYIVDTLGLDATIPDNQIVGTARYIAEKEDIIFVTNDICLKNIARSIGLDVESVVGKENIYKGYKIINGTSEQINIAMENMNLSDWSVNEYLIIQNKDDGSEKEMRFDGEKFVSLKLPSSKFIKAKNSLQRCALDILNNQDITIAAILGGYGSGKSFLSMQMALYNVQEKGYQSKILGIRSPQGEGVDVGYLPGTLEDKTDNFFLPLVQQLNGGEFELESLKQRGVLESNIPYYLKGTTYNDTIMLVDEAEDLDEKQIRLVGTRVGSNSKIYFAGDYKQSVINTTSNNALVKMCNEFRGQPNFATIYLGEDVRSSTSKMFANLFQD